jgi:hypothetical protein
MASICNRMGSVVVREIDGEVLLLDLDSSQIHQLNETASFVWRSCREAVSVQEIADQFGERFGVDWKTASKDVEDVLERLQSLNLIVRYQTSTPLSEGQPRFVWAIQQT